MGALALEPVPRRLPGPGVAWALALIALALIGVHEWMLPMEAQARTLCIFRNVTGAPCPTCGSTRSVLAMVRGDFVGAFEVNPLVAAFVICVVAVAVMRVGFRRRPVIRFARPALVWAVAAVLVVVNWAYVIARDG